MSAYPSVAAVGMFDGVHRGHQALLKSLVYLARRRRRRSLVLTFSEHPLATIRPGEEPKGLCPSREKVMRMQEIGVDKVEFLDFTPEFRNMTGEEFLKWLHREYGVEELLVGFNNHFGSDRMDASAARALEASTGVKILEASPYQVDGCAMLCSSAIRGALAAGDVSAAGRMLGRPYSLSGTVVHGSRVGHELGFPTANLSPLDPGQAVPPEGVYAVEVSVPELGFRGYGMTNIGRRPTVEGSDGSLSIETHIFNMNDDLYGRGMTLRFLKRMRSEMKFPDMEALRKQLESDAAAVLDVLGLNKC